MEQGLNFFFSILGKFGWLGNWLFLFFALLECVPFVGGIFPGATLIVVSGFLASQGSFRVIDILIFSTIGAFIGDYAGYSLGRYGTGWTKKIFGQNLMDKGEKFFNKYGYPSIFWGRFFSATRAVIPFIAGLSKMPQRSFLFWNLLSSLGWSIFNIALGYFSGSIIVTVIRKILHKPLLIIGILIFIGVIYWLIKRHGQNIKGYYRKQFQNFSVKSSTDPRWQRIERHYPATSEFIENESNRRRIFNALLITEAIVVLYLLTILLDLL
jgi:undecaprenyl-diphosphatase